MFIFSHENSFRKGCHFIVNHRWIGNSLLICILVSSSMLAIEDPVNYKSKTNDVCILLSFLCFVFRYNLKKVK